MSPGRARARPTFAKLSGMDDSAKHDFLHGHFQWPLSPGNFYEGLETYENVNLTPRQFHTK
jgi:hypothetical protein